MQHQTGRFSKEARAAAQLAFTKALAALEENEPLAPDERRFLVEQRPCGIDEVGRIVLEYPSESAAREAGLRAALTRIGRVLSERRLAAGVERTTIQPPRKRRKASGRSGPPISPILYLPTILASVTLPHKKVTGVEFRRMNGHLDVTMLAPSHIGLPYGVYPRLALMYLTTKAVLTRRRSFEVGESANDFLATMGIKDSGGAAGTSTRARDQLTRLTRTVFVYRDKRPAARDGHDHRPEAQGGSIPAIRRWTKWPEGGLEVTLGEDLYSMIRNGCLPLDAKIVAALRRSPLSLDAYAWLTYRLARLQHETLIPWRPLEAQFGAEYKHPRQFRWMFRKSLEAVKAQWDGVDAEARERGVYLRPCPPSVQAWIERTAARSRSVLAEPE